MPFLQAVKNPRSGSGGGFLEALDSDATSQPKGFYAAINSSRKDSADLESVDGLLKLAQQKGLLGEARDVADEDKLSFLQRLSSGLGALNPAEAVARDYEGTQNFLVAYPTTVLQGIASALTGNDYGEQTKKRYFGELLKDMGIENKYAQFGLGLVGDVLLDPSTYVGGTLVRLGAKGVGAVAKTGVKGLAKVSPEAAEHLLTAGKALKDAGGELFVFGYGASKVTKAGEAKGLAEGLLEFEGKKMNVEKGLAISNAKRHGSDVLTDSQWEEFLGYIFKGKSAEFNYFDTVTDDMLEAFNKKFPNARFPLKSMDVMKSELTEKFGREATDIEVRSAIRTQAINRLESVATTIPQKIGRLQALRDKLAQPFIANDLIGLKSTVSELRKELAELVPSVTKKVPKGKPFMATEEEMNAALMNALGSKKDEYTKMILDLEARIAGIESGIIEPATKMITKEIADKSARFTVEEILQQVMRALDPKLTIKDKIVQITNQITQLTNDMSLKQHLLEGVLAGKQIAKERIAKAFKTGDFSTLDEEIVVALSPALRRHGFHQVLTQGMKPLYKEGKPVFDEAGEQVMVKGDKWIKTKFTTDKEVQFAIEKNLNRYRQVAYEAGIDDPFVMYAPSIANDVTERQRILNFFNGTRGVRVGSKDYTKEFRNLLKDEELLKDRTLFLRVEDEIATNQLTEEFLKNTVDNYGQSLTAFKSEREATTAGYRVLKEKGIFGKEVGYVLEADWKFLNSHMNSNYKAFDAIAKATGFDAATSLFKRFVTGVFAPFHVRNYASGEIQNFEILGKVAQSPKVQATGLRLGNKVSRGAFSEVVDPFDGLLKVGKKVESFGEETIELHGKLWKLDDIGQAIERRFGGSSRYNVDYNSLTADANKLLDAGVWSKESLKDWGKGFATWNPVKGAWNLVSENNPLFKQARVIGTWIETQQKSKLVLGALEKGLSMDEALKVAAKGGFDYRALTMFESKILRRVIPFYSFNRKNIELQLHTLGHNPERINQVIRSIENVQNLWETNLTPEEKENLPAYLKEYLSVPVGRSKQGVPQFVRSFGTPIEAFTELVKFQAEGKSTIERTFLATLSKVNPYIKVPIELGIGKDSFRQRDIKDVYTAPDYEKAPQFLKDYLNLRAVTKKDFATGIPRTTYIADPERLLIVRSLFTSRGFTYFNNVFNGNIKGGFRVLDLLSGIRVAEVDVERQAGWNERRKREELGDLLRRNGVLSEFNKLFIPKEK